MKILQIYNNPGPLFHWTSLLVAGIAEITLYSQINIKFSFFSIATASYKLNLVAKRGKLEHFLMPYTDQKFKYCLLKSYQVRLFSIQPCFLNSIQILSIWTQKSKQTSKTQIRLLLTHCIMVDSSTVIRWTSPFAILEVLGSFCRFYSVFDGNPASEQCRP